MGMRRDCSMPKIVVQQFRQRSDADATDQWRAERPEANPPLRPKLTAPPPWSQASLGHFRLIVSLARLIYGLHAANPARDFREQAEIANPAAVAGLSCTMAF